ncbi:MAG: carbohydrate ABC transporter permease [Clostridiales bacterium]|nr:carbohydrate ABC transporter permease [Clostridiales bacterium]
MRRKISSGHVAFRIIAYTVCLLLALLSIFPFVIMLINMTRSTPEIQGATLSLIPSTHFMDNIQILDGKSFNAIIGFKNSFIISASATLLTLYFSALTAHALIAYNWKMRKPFFTFIMAVMMIPAQITGIGFFQFMYKIGMTNNFLPLIIPAMAAPAGVFFMRQFMLASLPLDLLEAARIDGAHEFYTFNRIVLPLMKPALATQGIFAFVTSWNALFMPMVLLTSSANYTMPLMVQLLRGDIYKTEYGAVYLALTMTVLPLFIVYFSLSKYIIAGVALGGVKG